MADQVLRAWHILVVEDEYLLASDLQSGLSDSGAIILGPVATLEGAIRTIEAERRIDGAILDVNLSGVMAYPVADLLVQRGVPFVFTTGYDGGAIPSRFEHVPRCQKPYSLSDVEDAIIQAIESHPRGSLISRV